MKSQPDRSLRARNHKNIVIWLEIHKRLEVKNFPVLLSPLHQEFHEIMFIFYRQYMGQLHKKTNA